MNKLTPKEIQKIIALRAIEEPVTIANLAIRFSVSERTIYYILSEWRSASRGYDMSLHLAQAIN